MLKVLLAALLISPGLVSADELKKPLTSLDKDVRFEVFVSTDIKKLKGIDKPTLKKLTSSDPGIRRNTVVTLGIKGNTKNLPVLLAMLYDEDSSVVRAAIRALTTAGDERAVKYLISKFDNTGDISVQYAVLSSLGELKSTTSLSFLKNNLKNAYPGFRHEALKALGKIKDPQTYPLIAEMINDESEGIKVTAARLSVELDIVTAAPLLVKNLDNRMTVVRIACADALGSLGDKDSIAPLKKLLKDKDEKVKNSANLAIEKINERFK